MFLGVEGEFLEGFVVVNSDYFVEDVLCSELGGVAPFQGSSFYGGGFGRTPWGGGGVSPVAVGALGGGNGAAGDVVAGDA